MSDISRSDVSKKPTEPPNLLKAIGSSIGSYLLKAIEYLSWVAINFKTSLSKSLRALVDKLKPIKILSINCDEYSVTLGFDKKEVRYASKDEKIAFDDLAITLGNPNLHLERFHIFFDGKGKIVPEVENKSAKIIQVFQSLTHKLSTKAAQFHMEQHRNYGTVLSFLKPGVLESITLTLDDGPEDADTISILASSEQWKQAKELEVLWGFVNFPLEHATHFKRICYWEMHFDGNKLMRIRDFAANSNELESFLVKAASPFNVSELLPIAGILVAPNDRVYHYSIPNSDDYLEFMFLPGNCNIVIKKWRK